MKQKLNEKNDKITIYHGSPKRGLTKLKPFESTQEGAYVYGTQYEEVAAMFSVQISGGSLVLDKSVDNCSKIPIFTLCERKEGILEQFHQPASIYEVDPTHFESFGIDNWEQYEVRASNEQIVLKENYYPDMYQRLLELEKKGNLKIVRYPQKMPWMADDNTDLVAMAFRLFKMGNRNVQRLKSFVETYPKFKSIVWDIYEYTKKLDDEELENFINTLYDYDNKKILFPQKLSFKSK